MPYNDGKMPNDPMMLLSFINTKLRDNYESLTLLCDDFNIKEEEILSKLSCIDYKYDKKLNRFI